VTPPVALAAYGSDPHVAFGPARSKPARDAMNRGDGLRVTPMSSTRTPD